MVVLGFIVTCRVIPHIANFSPMICVALFAGSIFIRRIAVAVVMLGMLLSDMLLAQIFHYPMVGSWSLFTYSALLAIVALGLRSNIAQQRLTLGIVTVLGSNLGFWLWTNFGSWLTNYRHTVDGFVTCYIAALPFLQHSTLSALVWYGLFMTMARMVNMSLVNRSLSNNQI